MGPGEECSLGQAKDVRITLATDLPLPSEAVLISSAGDLRRWPLEAGTRKVDLTVPGAVGYYRLELRDAKGEPLVLTNPVWIVR